jgi:hypothetical protein
MANPGVNHWKAVKHLFHYLAGTTEDWLTYAPDSLMPELFVTFSDANHAGKTDYGCSTSGYVAKIGTGAVSWSSKTESIGALSTTEAEFVAGVSACQEAIWMR